MPHAWKWWRRNLHRLFDLPPTMRLHVDKEADALYLRLDDSRIVESDEVAPGVILDYNEQKS